MLSAVHASRAHYVPSERVDPEIKLILRIAVVLPTNPVGYDEIESSGYDEDSKIFIMSIFRQCAQNLG